jgi:hypothetical protein
LGDVLASDGSSIFMGQERVFGADSGRKNHVFSTAGFRDDSWFNRTQWAVGAASRAQLLVFDDQAAYAVAAYGGTSRSGFFRPGDEGYLLFAVRWKPHASKPPAGAGARSGKTKRPGGLWATRVPVRVTAMALAGRTLLAAGTPDVVDPHDPLGALEGRKGAKLWIVSADDGAKLAEYQFDSPPVWDGMAVAGGRVYLATIDGSVLSFCGD